MTIRAGDVSTESVEALLAQDLRIPPYQRPYRWTPDLAVRLLQDLSDAAQATDGSASVTYVLGTVILHRQGDGTLDVVDGQQRVLTLRLILLALRTRLGNDHGDLATALSGAPDSPIGAAWTELASTVGTHGVESEQLAVFIREQCRVFQVVTDDLDEAFRIFDSQNHRGRPLLPHDLLKAHHLREMSGETEAKRVAVVEAWERRDQVDLDRLFSLYLFRIRRWSRGRRADTFEADDIGEFTGVSGDLTSSPRILARRLVHASAPVLGIGMDEAGLADLRRARFPIDEPVLPGSAFFEAVDAWTTDLEAVRSHAFDGLPGAEAFDGLAAGGLGPRPSRRRYRYITELYLAALLYAVSTVGEVDWSRTRDRLFRWAYGIRLDYERVGDPTIQRHAIAEDAPFPALRDAVSQRALAHIGRTGQVPGRTHDTELRTLLEEVSS
ncbi:DUF262 domain-containing protein [Brachybacterium squillarum]|uniref:DUF262 domain-containing protein n=1 Tax=Brachybacterium squillarum TaxID=661979 RepID=UPI0002629966|nr:DUF262 domain-containing protein [Brachybacterium squillarum]